METQKTLYALLAESGDNFLSGAEIAAALGITRAAVWKRIRKLESEGYTIEAVPNRGYRLALSDVVSEETLRKYLGKDADRFHLQVVSTITSTNTVLKTRAAESPEFTAIVAGCQTAGRGRIGRSFYSPADTGVYLSILLRPDLQAKDAVRITTAAAVAACRAIEECTEEVPSIKWVNDVFVRERKVCGILTEGSVNLETGGLDWAVCGIGLNVYEPKGGFPEELSGIAGAICRERSNDCRCALAAAFLRAFAALYDSLDKPAFASEYRARCFLLGKPIRVLKSSGTVDAVALDVDGECGLLVRYDDGSTEVLQSGEVSVRPQ